MKIKHLCKQCLIDNMPEGGGYVTMPYDPNSIVELTDDYYYEYTCNKGHTNKFFLAVPRYAILFDMGIMAYLDGYYREAVLDFAASYERFHEYCIYIFLWNNDSINKDDLVQLWKRMTYQSERQLGAFTALYYKMMNALPVEFPRKGIELRNSVTHKGRFPSQEEAYGYALQVADYIKSNMVGMQHLLGFDPRGNYPAIKDAQNRGEGIEGHIHMTVITQYLGGNSFEDSIELMKKQFHNFYVR